MVLEPLALIDGGGEELGAIDLMLVEGFADLAAGNEHIRGAEARHHSAAKAEAAHAKALDVLGRADLLGKPAGGFTAAEGARDDMHVHVRLVVHLLIKLQPVAGEEPLDIALGVGTEGKAGEQGRCGNLRGPEARG